MKTFFVEPETLELAIGETKEIRVWAFPAEVKIYKVDNTKQVASIAVYGRFTRPSPSVRLWTSGEWNLRLSGRTCSITLIRLGTTVVCGGVLNSEFGHNVYACY